MSKVPDAIVIRSTFGGSPRLALRHHDGRSADADMIRYVSGVDRGLPASTCTVKMVELVESDILRIVKNGIVNLCDTFQSTLG